MSTLRNVGRSGRAAGEQQRVARVDPEDLVLGVAARITGRDKCRHVLDRAGGWYGWVGVDGSAALVAHVASHDPAKHTAAAVDTNRRVVRQPDTSVPNTPERLVGPSWPSMNCMTFTGSS
jgi:hypothetical protein